MRREIVEFAKGMQKQLDAHAHSHGDAWKTMHPLELLPHLITDLGKLAFAIRICLYNEALRIEPNPEWNTVAEDVKEYALDVANVAMMIADRIGTLAKEERLNG